MYLESNFILELALGQEQVAAAEAILERAERQEVSLAVPSFSLSEPFSTVTHRSRNRKKVVDQLGVQLKDLGRSSALQDDVRSMELTPSVLVRIEKHETDSLISTIDRVMAVATVIEATPRIFHEAKVYRTRFGFSPQDSVIYAAVIRHLTDAAQTGPHYFVNKDKKDFRDADIAAELIALECELLRSFPEVALRLEQPLPD